MPILYLDSASFNNIQVSGSITLSGSTPLQGTSSWATNALTASTADTLTVRNNLIVSGNITLGDATTDSITMNAATMSLGSGTGILNIDSNTLVVDGNVNRVYINKTSGNATLDITGTINSSALIAGASQIASGVSGTGNALYRLTNTGGNVTPLFVNYGDLTAGTISVVSDNTNGLVFTAGNGSQRVARAGMHITNLVNTAGSESADLIFSTKQASPGNTAMIERVRINSTGTTNITGSLRVSGSSNIIGTKTITGSLNISGSITLTSGSVIMPNRSAFRVSGSNSTDITAVTTLTSTNGIGIDYNQGGNYNNTTGIYTAPVAGLYYIYMNIRVGSVSSQMQAIMYKNDTSVQLMWEAPDTGASTHFGVSGIVYLAANDNLRVKATVGKIQFDGNDSWGAAYIG